MAKKGRREPARARRGSIEVRVERVPGQNAWRLLHPRCSLERAEDIEEVEAMIDHGELELAVDELRWLLSGCPDFILAHRLLGELAVEAGDVALARGHFGHGYLAVLAALKAAGNPRPLPFAEPTNQDFFACGKGLAWCLKELKRPMAAEVVEQLLTLDPSDPLQVKQLL